MTGSDRHAARRGVGWVWLFGVLTVVLFGVRVVAGAAGAGWAGLLTVVAVFSAAAAVGVVVWMLLVGRVRSRAATAAAAAPDALLVVGDRNIDVTATLNLVFDVHSVPRILAWTFDASGATLWGPPPAAGPVLRLVRERAVMVGDTMISTGRESFPGLRIDVHDHARDVDRPVAFLLRDPAHPTRPCNADRVQATVGAIRALWQLEGP